MVLIIYLLSYKCNHYFEKSSYFFKQPFILPKKYGRAPLRTPVRDHLTIIFMLLVIPFTLFARVVTFLFKLIPAIALLLLSIVTAAPTAIPTAAPLI